MEFDHRKRYASTGGAATHDAPTPGKQTLTQNMVQLHPAAAPSSPRSEPATTPPPLPVPAGPRPTLQMLFRRRGPPSDPEQVHAAAARGTATTATQLPHLAQIQRSFGKHDVSGVQTHVGGEAAASAQEMGAAAFATGNHVVLGAGTDLHTVAHEAAHVVQQRAGVHLKGGVGEVGDAYERQADAVADAVVRGESAEALLDQYAAPGASATGAPVQRFFDQVNKNRLAEARLDRADTTDNLQLDHAVSQDTLESLAATLTKIATFTQPSSTEYQISKTALQKLDDQIDAMPEALARTGKKDRAGLFRNLRVNLTPGFKETTGNPGSTFDPPVEKQGQDVVKTAAAGPLQSIDDHARALRKLASNFPTQAESATSYNRRVDAEAGKAMDGIAAALKALENMAPPKFDSQTWYKSGQKHVKRAPAEWPDGLKPANLGSKHAAPEVALVEFKWELTIQSLQLKPEVEGARKDTAGSSKKSKSRAKSKVAEPPAEREYEDDIAVTVAVQIQPACWKHIYERHTVDYFAGDVQAINTFWKEDPRAAITEQLVKPELNLLIDRKLNLRRFHQEASGDPSKIETENINEPADRLFFQGSMDLMADGGKLDIAIDLKSCAPQDPSLAVAYEPAVLKA